MMDTRIEELKEALKEYIRKSDIPGKEHDAFVNDMIKQIDREVEKAELAAVPLDPDEVSLLCFIDDNGPTNIETLTRLSYVNREHIEVSLERMVKRGLLGRLSARDGNHKYLTV